MTRASFTAALVALALLACGSDEGSSGGAAGQASSRTTASAVVFNEFNATGSAEWLELLNTGSSAVDLSGHALADTDKDTGKPRADGAMRFPAGTTLEAGARLVVLTSQADGSTVGPHPASECVAGASSCLYATFGVSAATGESVHLLGPDDAIVTSTGYPLAAGASAGQTACRLPDGTGEFAACSPTPGAANAAP